MRGRDNAHRNWIYSYVIDLVRAVWIRKVSGNGAIHFTFTTERPRLRNTRVKVIRVEKVMSESVFDNATVVPGECKKSVPRRT